MTILEKFMEKHPGAEPEAVIFFTCPQDFGLGKPASPCKALNCADKRACRECWGREYQEGGGNGHKILERTLCPSCERQMSEAHVVHKKVPYSEGSATCDWCHKKRYCTRYKVRIGKGDGDGQAEADQP